MDTEQQCETVNSTTSSWHLCLTFKQTSVEIRHMSMWSSCTKWHYWWRMSIPHFHVCHNEHTNAGKHIWIKGNCHINATVDHSLSYDEYDCYYVAGWESLQHTLIMIILHKQHFNNKNLPHQYYYWSQNIYFFSAMCYYMCHAYC